MPKTIQVRHVPDEIHRQLKVKAAQRGQTLTDSLLPELERLATMPSQQELLERLMARPTRDLGDVSVSEIIRRERAREDSGT